MIKKFLIGAFAAAAVGVGILAGGMTASATTVEDVIAEARYWGYPESSIQDGYNYYLQNPDNYDENDFDLAISYIRKAGKNLITTGPQKTAKNPTTTTTTVTTVPVPSTDKAGNKVTGKVNDPDANQNNETTPKPASDNDEITLTMPDGSTFTRISKKAFIKLSYDEKMAYISTFTPEQQQFIIDNLAPEEYRSLLKQLPADQKLEVVDELAGAVEAMGMNLTVEDISDDSLSVAMRSDDGEIISVSNAGNLVEDTGYDRRNIYAAAGALFFASVISAFLLVRHSFTKKSQEK